LNINAQGYINPDKCFLDSKPLSCVKALVCLTFRLLGPISRFWNSMVNNGGGKEEKL